MLRTRLFLNLVPFVVILLAVGVYAIVLFSRLAESFDASVTENYGSILASQEMNLALAGLERELWVSVNQRDTEHQPFAEFQKRFEANLALQLKNISLPGEKELNEELAASYETFRQAMNQVHATDHAETLRDLYHRKIIPETLRMNALLEKIRKLNHRGILAMNRTTQRITDEVTRLMVIGMAVALIISAYACFRLSRSILEPIKSLTQATRALGEGKLDHQVPVLSRDELGDLAGAFNKMAAQLQEYHQSTTDKIVRLHRTMETTLASFPDPIFVLNQAGGIELKNPAAEEFGLGLQLKGQLPQALESIARKTLETGADFLPNTFNEAQFYRVNHSGKFFLPRVLAMRDKANAPIGVAVVLYDVTRFRLLDAAKSNLVATVSHELKTPLTSVRMTLHILLEKTLGALSARQTELLTLAREDTERLLRILNDLLDLTRLEEGSAELRKDTVAVSELLDSILSEMADSVALHGLKLTSRVEADLPSVTVDRQRIRYVFSNLIANAIKHSPPGGVIRLAAAPAKDDWVEFTVTDQGPGVPEEYQSRIFDRFFRVPGQTKTGAGLGLSIAREITVAHGGRIGVRSRPDRGSTFYVVLKAGA